MNLLERRKGLTREEFMAAVVPKRPLFRTKLALHFKSEEMTLFPILILKSPETRSAVLKLLIEHSEIMERFREFEAIQDYEDLIVTLNDPMYRISQHAMKEDEILRSVTLTAEEEEARACEVARIIESWPPLIAL